MVPVGRNRLAGRWGYLRPFLPAIAAADPNVRSRSTAISFVHVKLAQKHEPGNVELELCDSVDYSSDIRHSSEEITRV